MSNLNLHAPDAQVTDPKVALNYLKEGNERFVTNNLMPRNTNPADLKITNEGQKPFAAVLTCADSRTAPELFFDQKLGDIFVLRNAGNYADEGAIGSIEFAVGYLKAPLVVVVGHTKCGAVITSHGGATGFPEGLQAILDKIRKNIKTDGSVEEATADNVKYSVELLKNNPVIKKEGAMVVGAHYDLATGKVTFM